MKRKSLYIMMLIMAGIPFISCATGREFQHMAIYNEVRTTDNSVYLRTVQLEPSHSFRDLEGILSEAILSILTAHGMKAARSEEEAALCLDVCLQRRDYQRDYEDLESITLTLTLFEDHERAVFLLYTEDTSTPLDSFPHLFAILDKNITRLFNSQFSKIRKKKKE